MRPVFHMMSSAAFDCSGLEVIVAIDPAPVISEASALFDHSLRPSMVSSFCAERQDDEARDNVVVMEFEKAEISRLNNSATQKSRIERVLQVIIIISSRSIFMKELSG